MTKLQERYKSKDPEIWRYRKNWIVLYIMGSITAVAYFIAIPSLHQFVTSSTNPSDPDIQPGLGLSETWYSWIVSMSSFGEFIGAVILGILIRWFYAKHLMLAHLCVCVVGGVFYGVGKFGWMLLIGRLLIGVSQGGQLTIVRVYLGETSNTVSAMLPPEKQRKTTVKNTNFVVYSMVGSIFTGLGPGLTAIAAQIPGLDQFRWSGYYLVGHSAVMAVVILALFREKWTDLARGGGCSCSFKKLPVPVPAVVYLVFAFFLINCFFTVLETLENPILSDNFGFTITYTSYVFLSSLVLLISSNILIYLFQKCGIDNRVIALIGLCLYFSGTIIASDWQAIGGDPCSQFSENSLSGAANISYGFPDTTDMPYQQITPIEGIKTLVLNSSSSSCTIDTPQLEFNGACGPCTRQTVLFVDIAKLEEHDFTCQVMEDDELCCYWREMDLCVNFSLPIIEASGLASSGILLSDGATLTCNFTVANLDHTTTVLLLFAIDNSTSDYLKKNCPSDTKRTSYCEQNHHDYNCIAYANGVNLDMCDSNASCICEAFSGSPYHCFWNPNSRITGKYCARCPQLCRSVDHTLNFIQFVIGVSLIALAHPIGRTVLTLIASDAMGTISQGLIMGILVAAGSAARFTSPLWANAAYIAVGRRTFLAMNILNGLMSLTISLYVPLYRSMKPKDLVTVTVGMDVPNRENGLHEDEVFLMEQVEPEEHTDL